MARNNLAAILSSFVLGCAPLQQSEQDSLVTPDPSFYNDKTIVDKPNNAIINKSDKVILNNKPLWLYELLRSYGNKQKSKNLINICDEYGYNDFFGSVLTKISFRDCQNSTNQSDLLYVESVGFKNGGFKLLFEGIAGDNRIFLSKGSFYGLSYDINNREIDKINGPSFDDIKHKSSYVLNMLNVEAEKKIFTKIH